MDETEVDLSEFEADAPTLTCGGTVPDGSVCGNQVHWFVTSEPHEHNHSEWLCGGHKVLLEAASHSLACKDCGADIELTFSHV